jgi:hypothetical protein
MPRKKSKNWKTNPNLAKPAWKIVPGKAKNEPKSDPNALWENFWAKGHGDNVLGEFRPEKALGAGWRCFGGILVPRATIGWGQPTLQERHCPDAPSTSWGSRGWIDGSELVC